MINADNIDEYKGKTIITQAQVLTVTNNSRTNGRTVVWLKLPVDSDNPARVQTKSTHLYQDSTVKVKIKVLGYKKDYLGSTDKYPTVRVKKVFK